MARDPAALFWVQIAHALQYLAFPVRVELNRSAGKNKASPRRVVLHMAGYAIVLLAVSIAVAQLVPLSIMGVVGNIFGDQPRRAAPILLLMFINIHHYFTDGVIWKISNPDVRRDLFAHVAAKRQAVDGVARDAAEDDAEVRRRLRASCQDLSRADNMSTTRDSSALFELQAE